MLKSKRLASVGVLAAILVTTLAGVSRGVEPQFVAGNPTCVGLGYDLEFKLNFDPGSGTYEVDDTRWVKITKTGSTELSWESNFGIDAVIMKGGPNANVYVYEPEAVTDSGLTPPINPTNGSPYGISHVSFCYDLELEVSKTAETSLTRTWEWEVTKSVDPDEHHLFVGDSDESEYTIVVDKVGSTDSDWAVTGEITLTNPDGSNATMEITSIVDVISDFGGTVTVDCNGEDAGDGLPLSIAEGDSATCTYSAEADEADEENPFGDTNTVTVDYEIDEEAQDAVAATADVIWDEEDPDGPTVTEVNPSVDVIDDFNDEGDVTIATGVTDDTTFTADDLDGEAPASYAGYLSREFDCDGNTFDTDQNTSDTVDYDNTVRIESGGEKLDEDSATVQVTCYVPTISKTADTSLARDYDWDIEKVREIQDGELDTDGDPSTLMLEAGDSHTATYKVTATMTGYTDDNHAISGVITIHNPHPEDSMTIEDLSDVLTGDATAVTIGECVDADEGDGVSGDASELTIDAGATAECVYSVSVDGPDATKNTASFTLFDEDYEADADVSWADADVTEIDECIDIVDDAGTPADDSDDIDLGTVCVPADLDENDQWSDTYELTIGPFEECGTYTFTNTVSFETTDDDNDTDESGSDDYTVTIDVPCGSCTYTIGYWKTHSSNGPAPYDATWELLGEGNLFFLGNLTYYETMWTPPAGNAYYVLAPQYIGAILNGLNGADTSAITEELAAAQLLFETWTPDQVAAAKGKAGMDLRNQFTSLANVLDDYNNGDIGPGHCDLDVGDNVFAVAFLPVAGLALLKRRDGTPLI